MRPFIFLLLLSLGSGVMVSCSSTGASTPGSVAVVSHKHGVELWSDGLHYRLHNTNAYPVNVTWKDSKGRHQSLVYGPGGIAWRELAGSDGVVKLVHVQRAAV